MGMSNSTQVSQVIHAPQHIVYGAFIDPHMLAKWLAPGTMRGHVHMFDPSVGGKFRMSLTYQNVDESPDGKGGKSSDDTDTFEGEFVELTPDEKIVWATEFEADDPDFA